MSNLYSNDKQKGTVSWITFSSTLIFPMLSIELFEGVKTHIWTGIIFGFILHILFAKKYPAQAE